MGATQHDQSKYDEAIKLVKKGLRPYAIARKIDINPSTACDWFRKINIGQERIQKKNDHTDAVYGEWTVLRELDRRPQYGYKAESGETIPLWEVKCSCGKITKKTGTNLQALKKKQEAIDRGEGRDTWRMHCNDHPMHIMPCKIGDKLGDLEVVSFPKNTSQRRSYKTYKGNPIKGNSKQGKWWIGCICHACNKHSMEKPHLVSMREWKVRGKRLENNPNAICACGCNRSVTHGLSRPQESGHNESMFYTLWQSTKASAKSKGLKFNLTPQYLESLGIPEKCPVLGIDVKRTAPGEGRSWHTPSVDKFYPELGYVKGNVQIVSWRANHLKSDGTPEEWKKIAKWCKKEDVRMRLEGRHPDQQKKNT